MTFSHRPISRTEVCLAAGITVLGLLVRVLFLSEIAVEHFDEGVYASNLWFPDSGFAYPSRHLYAPPLLPSLIEWSLIVFGGAGKWVPFLPGLILGTATVPLVWWVTRRWFGAAAGVAAAGLIALSDFHILLSRSALTDAPLLFFLVLAVWLFHEALTSGSWRLSIVAGVATGLAWATKYNGWLPLAIGVCGASAAWLFARGIGFQPVKFSRESDRLAAYPTSSLRRLAIGCVITIVVAGLVWLPVWWDLQSQGGYSAVAANHRNYVVGFGKWVPSLSRHVAIQEHFAGLLTLGSGVLAALAAGLVLRSERSPWNAQAIQASELKGASSIDQVADSDRSPWNGEVTRFAIVMTAVMASSIVVNPLLILVFCPTMDWLASAYLVRRDGANRLTNPRWLALWFCLAWMLGLALMTPTYRPYPRLALPLMCAGWIGMGTTIVRLLTGKIATWNLPSSSHPQRVALWILLVMIALVGGGRALRHGVPIWQPRLELAEVAGKLMDDVRRDSLDEPGIAGIKRVVYVYAEPGLLFHLPADDVAVGAVTDLSFSQPNAASPKLPTYLVAGPHALQDPRFKSQFADAKRSLKPVTVYPYRPSDFVLLDDVPPRLLEEHRVHFVRVYRVVPKR